MAYTAHNLVKDKESQWKHNGVKQRPVYRLVKYTLCLKQ